MTRSKYEQEQLRRRLRNGGIGLGIALVMLVAAWLIDDRSENVPRGTSVAGVELGGDSGEAAFARLEPLAATYEGTVINLIGAGTEGTATASDLGLAFDREATTKAALDRGFVLFRPFKWAMSWVVENEVEPVIELDKAQLEREARRIGAADNGSPIELSGGQFVAVNLGSTMLVDIDQLGDDIVAAVKETPGGTLTIQVPFGDAVEVNDESAQALAAEANRLSPGDLEVVAGDARVVIPRAVVQSWLRIDQSSGEPKIGIDDDAILDSLTNSLASSLIEPQEATFSVEGGTVVINGGRAGTLCCAEGASAAVFAALDAEQNTVDIELRTVETAKSLEWAEGLGINELIGEFTTNFTAGEPRVTNIERIVELTKGIVIEPGETFSVNDTIGRRTTANGFVGAPVIYNGVITQDIGGGISQYATTLFNAAFFGGLDFGEYQSHSIEISRYPRGREATLSYPSPDLEIINSTPYGVLIWPTTTDTSVTVQLYSTVHARGEDTGQTERPEGEACIRVTTERTRTYVSDGHTETDSVYAVYRPEGIACDGTVTDPSVTTTTTTTTTTTAPPPETTQPPVTPDPTTPPPESTTTTTTTTTTEPPVELG